MMVEHLRDLASTSEWQARHRATVRSRQCATLCSPSRLRRPGWSGASHASRAVAAGPRLPGKLLWKLDPGALGALADRLPLGCVVISATNGKTTTSTIAAEILSERHRLAWNHSGANLASGVTSALLEGRNAELGLLEVDEFALPTVIERTAPRVVVLGNLFRDQLDRYGELEHIAERWRHAVTELPQSSRLALNADDPLVATLGEGRPGTLFFGVDDPSVGRAALQHAADSKYCVRCGTPYAYAAAYVGHLGDYRCPACGHARPQRRRLRAEHRPRRRR